ncbi:MAG: EamA family transporter [Actinomycetota bacterium]
MASIIAAAMLFGTAGTALELGPEGAEPLSVGALRVAIGTVVLWIAACIRTSVSIAALKTQRTLILCGGAGVAVYTPLFLGAVERAGVAVATIVAISTGPFAAATLDWAWRHNRPPLSWLTGTALTVAGAALLVSTSAASDKQIDAVGVALAITAGFGYGAYSVTSKATIERGLDMAVALAAPFTIGTVLLLAAALVGSSWSWLGEWDGIALAAYLGVFATGASYLLFGFGLAHLTAATAVTLVLAEPVTAALLAVLVLDETISWLGWLGIGIVVIGLVVVGRTGQPTTAADATHSAPQVHTRAASKTVD